MTYILTGSAFSLKGELQRENKLISYERAFKMLEKDMYIAGIGIYDLTGILTFSQSTVETQAKILHSFVSSVIIIIRL